MDLKNLLIGRQLSTAAVQRPLTQVQKWLSNNSIKVCVKEVWPPNSVGVCCLKALLTVACKHQVPTSAHQVDEVHNVAGLHQADVL